MTVAPKRSAATEEQQNPAYSHQKAEAIPKGIASVLPFAKMIHLGDITVYMINTRVLKSYRQCTCLYKPVG